MAKTLDLFFFFAVTESKILWQIVVYQYMLNLEYFLPEFNTNENFYSFLLAQQDETKSIVPKQFSCSYSFEKYIQIYLPSFSIDDAEKYDLY